MLRLATGIGVRAAVVAGFFATLRQAGGGSIINTPATQEFCL